MGPRYARNRDVERRRNRLSVVLLAALCLVLSCRPADDPVSVPTVESTTPKPAEPAPIPDDVEPTPEPSPVETRELLPDTPPTPRASDQPLGPLVLRVGLATDLEHVDLPCCDRRIQAAWGDEAAVLPLDRAVRVSPEAGIGRTAVYRLQVAALKDPRQAQGIADYLKSETDLPTESVFDADTDLYRVRVGRFADREAAESAKLRISGLGVAQSWIVSEGGELENAALRVTQGEARYRVDDRWLELQAPDDVGIPFGRTRYRGKLLVFLNERGLLNVINEVPLESYLRGVVPKEMGPELYNEPEALKAQTVAARTYTLRNLGEFADEGYDICSTPRCQVYGGMGVEHPVSDRAVSDTDGQVLLWAGKPAETFYSATSGGHTENVEVMFPLKTGEYLRGVPCIEAGPTHIRGQAPSTATFPAGLMQRLLPSSAGRGPQVLSARLEHLALQAGLAPPKDTLGSLKRGEVLRFLMSIYDMALDGRLAERSEVDRLLRRRDADWAERDRRFGSYLLFEGFLEPKADRPLDAAEVDRLLFEVSLYLGVLRESRGHFLKLEKRRLVVRQGGKHVQMTLPDAFDTYRRRQGRLVGSVLDMMAGDRLRIYRHRGQVTALVQPLDAPPVVLGKRAPKQRWQVFKTEPELRRAVQKRYPGFPFVDFEVLSRGVSGRVARMALIGDGGERMEVDGLAVRWTLDVWDNLFQAEKTVDRSGRPGWLFKGRGWGHGVGMSQAGAFGMAKRGVTYREILQHYYTGVELGRLKPVAPRPRLPAG